MAKGKELVQIIMAEKGWHWTFTLSPKCYGAINITRQMGPFLSNGDMDPLLSFFPFNFEKRKGSPPTTT